MTRHSQEISREQSPGGSALNPGAEATRRSQEVPGQQSSGDTTSTHQTDFTRPPQVLHKARSFGGRSSSQLADFMRPFDEESRGLQSSGVGSSSRRADFMRPLEGIEMTSPTERRGVQQRGIQQGDVSDLISHGPLDPPVSYKSGDAFKKASIIEEGAEPVGGSSTLGAHFHRQAQRLLRQELKLNPDDPAVMGKTVEIHEKLQAIDSAKKRISDLQGELVDASPRPKTLWGKIKRFNFPLKATVEWQTRKWEVQIKGKPDTRTLSGKFANTLDKINKPLERLMQKTGRLGKLGFAGVQATISSAFPSAIAKKFVWATIATSLIPSLVTNRLFEDGPRPLAPALNTVQWEVANVGGYFFQEAVQPSGNSTASKGNNSTTSHFGRSTTSHSDTSMTGQSNKFTNRELSDFMSERLDNIKHEPTANEIVDILKNSVDDFLAQKGYPITFD